jgi:hypothetical protein
VSSADEAYAPLPRLYWILIVEGGTDKSGDFIDLFIKGEVASF